MMKFTFFSTLYRDSYIVFIAKTASKKIGALICSMKFRRLLCISINLPYDHEWETAVMPDLVFLANTWECYISYKNISAGLLVLHLLAHHRNVASLSFFYRYYFGRCSSELAQVDPHPWSQGRSSSYSDRLHDFSVTIPGYYKDVYVNSLFSRDPNGFKSRTNRHYLTVGSF